MDPRMVVVAPARRGLPRSAVAASCAARRRRQRPGTRSRSMSAKTPIEWADSSVNPVMGCDGCELWRPEDGIEICYAGVLHKMRGGKVKGYARDFLVPELFAGRMAQAARASDLRGKRRPDK